jgi:hypothetical protein
MRIRIIITIVLLVFVAASVAYLLINESRKGGEGADAGLTDSGERDHRIVAYYFHGNKRCVTCKKIEAYTKEAIETGFADQLEAGKLEFYIINVDESPNERYVYQYRLTTKSVILAECMGERPTRWKNLEEVWDHVGDKDVFTDYISQETSNFLREAYE